MLQRINEYCHLPANGTPISKPRSSGQTNLNCVRFFYCVLYRCVAIGYWNFMAGRSVDNTTVDETCERAHRDAPTKWNTRIRQLQAQPPRFIHAPSLASPSSSSLSELLESPLLGEPVSDSSSEDDEDDDEDSGAFVKVCDLTLRWRGPG
jgi:hypothetical protein